MSQSDTIRTALADALSASPLFAATAMQVSPYLLSNPTPPYAQITEGEIDYDLAMAGGMDELGFIVIVGVGYTTDIGSEVALASFRDPNQGVKAAIEADVTLGGVIDTCRVEKASEPKLYGQQTGPAVLGCEFTVAVYAHR